jgi:hypothetical protein
VLTDRPFGPWAAGVWPALSDAVLDEVHAAMAGTGPRARAPGG